MTGRAALAITAASISAGVLNYLFQVHAATALDAAAFGMFSAWLARVGAIGAAATVVQFLSLDFELADRRFRSLLRLVGGLAFAVLAVHLVFGDALSRSLLGVSVVASGIVLYAVVGQLQARLRLGLVAASLFVVTALRFAIPFLWPNGTRAQGFTSPRRPPSLLGWSPPRCCSAWCDAVNPRTAWPVRRGRSSRIAACALAGRCSSPSRPCSFRCSTCS